MALKQSQYLKLQQKLLPQQIQLMKLLQLPTMALEERIKEELELNPALEEADESFDEDDIANNEDSDNDTDVELDDNGDVKEKEVERIDDEVGIEDYMGDDELDSYKYEISNKGADDETREFVVVEGPDFHNLLEQQLGLRELNETEYTIGVYIIGCIDEDGYLRREIDMIVDDLAFNYNITSNVQEIEKVLKTIQSFDPPGVGARTIQECLLIQLNRKVEQTKDVLQAIEIVKDHMEEFSKKHYEKILKKMNITSEELKEVIDVITHLNPKPGDTDIKSNSHSEIVPDFLVSVTDGKPEFSINSRNMPDLKISKEYLEMLKEYSRQKNKDGKEATTFIKSKIESAQWFIDALNQRHLTLMLCMQAILEFQEEYFITGDEGKLKPMILKDIATKVEMDISTVSRMANSKYAQTPYGTFLLKTFFSESMSTDSGEEVSSREIKKILKDCVDAEDKHKPLTDDALCDILKEKGYNIARRTVAKYREQLDIPVARMRREV
ncbi:MAG: RNA polymerase factor sigma-54 [Sphingobacteriaceae bacterium]|nr:RNA polymerase factor sigma-54 [Sphingobacteriaceae bacterium]MBK7816580.1 RNA polymerase factor sigma-54 [Sphingobacteriaceae bacterium]